jgi:hypothetical protein
LKHKESIYEFIRAKSSKETKVFDVVILHDVIFKEILKTGEMEMDDIIYERWTKAAVEKIDSGEAELAPENGVPKPELGNGGYRG